MVKRVHFFPLQSFNLVYGGFEVQIESTFNCLKELNPPDFIIEKNNQWDKFQKFDIAHLWGLNNLNFQTIDYLLNSKIKIVITVLLPFWGKNAIVNFLKKNLGDSKKIVRYLNKCDSIIVVSAEQKEALLNICEDLNKKIHIIPNVIMDIYFDNQDQAFCINNQFICVGNISPRKNQLFLAKAASELNLNIKFIGNLDQSTDSSVYIESFKNIISSFPFLQWQQNINPGSLELLTSLKESAGFILLSDSETQPISAIEASIVGLPLMLSSKKWAKQSIFDGSLLCDISSLKLVKSTLNNFIINPGKYKINKEKLEIFSSRNVAEKYVSVYKSLFL